jgi:acyl-CoA synthetase (AMP-forming)/AMP-acid ligase II
VSVARLHEHVRRHATDPARAGVAALVAQDGPTWSYAELAGRIDAASHALRHAGVAAGQRVLLVGENSADMVALLLGAVAAGAWAVPLNARMAAGEIDGIVAHCEPRLVYFSGASAEALAHADRLQATQAWQGGRMALRDHGVAAEPQADAVALMLYTSGSTGRPKGVMLTHANMDFVTAASMQQGVLLPGDRIFHSLPISHSFGLVSALLCALRAGATVHLCPRFAPATLAHAILHEGITVFQGVPAMYARLCDWSAQTGTPLVPNRLRMCYIGGSQIDPTRKAQAEALLGLQLHHGYGLTESAPAATRTFGHPPPERITAGWPIPGVEVVLRDAAGQVQAPPARGEVCIRGPNVMKGYFRDEAQTRVAIDPEGWLRTGDIGEYGPEGDLSIVGRLKEMIIRGGFNVYPAEVEAAIAAFPGVAQCAVLGLPVAGDEEIVGFVEPLAGRAIDFDALAAFLRGRIAPYKVPRHWKLMEQLPASPTGKLLKPALRLIAARMLEAE